MDFNKLGDIFMNVGKTTLQTGMFYAATKAINSPCNRSIFSFGGCMGNFPMMGMNYNPFGCGSFPMTGMNFNMPVGGCNMGMGMYSGMNMLNSPYGQMALGQAYGQGYALGEQLKLSAQNGNNNGMFGLNMLGNLNTIHQQQGQQQEEIVNGEQFAQNTREMKDSRFLSSQWQNKAEGAEKDTEYKQAAQQLAQSFLSHVDKVGGNSDDSITLEEYISYSEKTEYNENATEAEKEIGRPLSEAEFRAIDLNSDVKIDKEEMTALIATYDAADGKQDGNITNAGIIDVASKFFDDNQSISERLKTQYKRLFGNNP